MQTTWRALLQDIELMPQNQDFGCQPPWRLEAVAQQTDGDHVLIRRSPRVKWIEFSEATGRRSPDKRDEIAAFHSITSSARTSSIRVVSEVSQSPPAASRPPCRPTSQLPFAAPH